VIKIEIMEQITLELPSNLAKRFYSLSIDDKNTLLSFFTALLDSKTMTDKKRQKAKDKLLHTMAHIGQNASEKGLTDDILQNILNEQ
jgi:hypothetical protein